MSKDFVKYYEAMLESLGPSGWWPGETPFEIAVGAVLTQNTSWANVEKAIPRLRDCGGLTPYGLWKLPVEDLEEAIRPAGVFRIKAQRLRSLVLFMADLVGEDYPPDDASLSFMNGFSTYDLREGLLNVRGIGPETADCILLYALNRPSFVVDAYTARIFQRHGLVPEEVTYPELQEFFIESLPEDVRIYNEYHALIVRVGKEFCKKSKPHCDLCPLSQFLEYEPEY